ncbi:DUF4249 family protein, partial [Fulvivirga lutimaris]|uniref:DUF4249 family protein n=1 Tax=Fulvivirga lutimaris TaxID=1819566 RepID=UPI0012BD3C10
VHIVLDNGLEYESDFQTMPEPLRLGDIKVDYIEEELIIDKFTSQKKRYHQPAIEIKNTNDQLYFNLNVAGYSEMFVKTSIISCPIEDGADFRFSCWKILENIGNEIVIGTNENIESSSFFATTNGIPVDSKGRFVGTIEINSITADSYLFFQQIVDQLAQTGTMFDPPFSPITGNIKPLNSSTPALGYFHTMSSLKETFCIVREDISLTTDLPFACYPDILCIDIFDPAVEDLPQELIECFN